MYGQERDVYKRQGPVGLCAMQCARLFGAAKVIALDIDTVRLNAAYQFGLADVTVNPLLENVNDKIVRITQGRGADGVVEAAGGRDSFQIAWQIARPNSVVALVACLLFTSHGAKPGFYQCRYRYYGLPGGIG